MNTHIPSAKELAARYVNQFTRVTHAKAALSKIEADLKAAYEANDFDLTLDLILDRKDADKRAALEELELFSLAERIQLARAR
jgi:hypothetical protein